MSETTNLSMNEMPLHDHRQEWTDGHITVRYLGFTPVTGDAHFEVIEHHDNVGFYYIWVIYGPDSGPPPGQPSQSSYSYDGAHPKRFEAMKNIVVGASPGEDPIRGIKVKRVRD